MDYTVTIQEETEKVTQAVVHKSVEIIEGQYGHYIYKKDEMIYIPCGGAVYVKNAITEVETCKQYLTLYFDSGDGKRRTILFPREDLVENKIVSLTAYGVQVSKKTADYLIKSIENQEVNVKHLLCHAKLGMAEWNGEKIFKGAKGVGIDSKYTGKLKVQQVYNGLRKKSNRSNNPLSASTIKHIDRILKCALNVAVDEGIIKENPVRKMKIGKDIRSERLEVYTVEEIRALEKAVRGTDMELPVALLFDCVMRRGELLGLRYSDIDFDKKEVTIQHAWTETETNEPVLKDCKTESSYRKLIVSDHTINLLRRQRTIYMRNRMKYGEKFCNSNHVICKENGEPYRPKSFTSKWSKTLKKCGLRHIKLHGTRHSAISLLLSEGVPIQIAQQRAGHQDPKITLGVYSHVSKDKESLVADTLEDVLFSAVGE